MLTTFSMAAARNFPLTLQATGARLGSPGEPTPLEHSSGEPSLKTHTHVAIITLLHHTEHGEENLVNLTAKSGRTHVLIKTHVCCRVYWFLFTFQTRTVPSLPLVAKRLFLLHQPKEITYRKQKGGEDCHVEIQFSQKL